MTLAPLTLTVAPRLARRESAAPADAFLLPGAGLLPAALALPGARTPQLYRVAGGFVAVVADSTTARLAGAVALRRLGGDLFVPADADLIPALLPDEVAGLTRNVGLVVLPGGAVLGFDPHSPLAPCDWLKLPGVARAGWEPLPAPEPLADRLTTIERPPQPVAVESLLNEGEPGGREPLAGAGESAGAVPDGARPPSAGALDRARAGAGFAAGKLLALLGALAGAPGLAKAGADLVRRAVERVPRLSEKVMGEQEAALREVLRQLKSGDVERALKRAPIAVGDPAAPSRVDGGSSLGKRDPRYSLRSLLGGGGVASAWLGGGDVWASLAAEYRRLADEAVARGDYRRAAYLHGVLLRDLRGGGGGAAARRLFRDAALIYRDRLSDAPAAARAFEQAGDSDEAVRLYQRAGLDVEAGDLLAKLGLADRAALCYTVAADKFAANGRFVAAGDLMRTKLGGSAAWDYYRRGWETAGPESATCGLHLLDHHLVAADFAAASALLAEAEVALAPPRFADAGHFFNHARRVGADFLPAEMRDDLDDQARRVFAAHLRDGGAGRHAASHLFGRWDGAVARDAVYSTRKLATPEAMADSVRRLTAGKVVAVAVARDSRAIAVATEVAVVLWQPDAGKVLWVCGTGGARVVSLAVETRGRDVFALLDDGERLRLCSYTDTGLRRFERHAVQEYGASGAGWFVAPAPGRGVTLDMAGVRGTLDRDLLHRHQFEAPAPPAVLVVSDGRGWRWEWAAGALRATDPESGAAQELAPHWTPAAPAGLAPNPPPLDWRRVSPFGLEVAGVDADGVLHWGEWDAPAGADIAARQASLGGAAGYAAACLTGAGRVAAVDSQNRVHWLRYAAGELKPTAPAARVESPARAVALVARPHAGEVVAILADATAVRLRVPG